MSDYDNGDSAVNEMSLVTLFDGDSQCDDKLLRGLTGLRNLGNTCYLNSALQALSNCPQFREYFRSFLVDDVESASTDMLAAQNPLSVSYAFKELLSRIWANEQFSSVAPTLMLMRIREKCPQFRTFAQQDSQEFIRCFLDSLHQELRRPVKQWEVDFMSKCSSASSQPSEILPDCTSVATSSAAAGAAGDISGHGTDHDDNDNENFETADSGLSSDTEDSPKSYSDRISESTSNAEKNSRDKIVGYRSIVTDTFDGELVSSVKCQTCQHISYTNENFQDISLSIPTVEQLDYLRDSRASTPQVSSTSSNNSSNVSSSTELIKSSYGYLYWFLTFTTRWLLNPWFNWFNSFYRYIFAGSVTLEHCLKAFFSMDFLHGDDMYSCEKCSKLRNGVKQCELMRLPEILCIHLKRFRHDNMYNSKVSTRVHFPLNDLDLRPFVKDSILEKNDQMITQYDLVAIVSHRGGSVDFGHYIAYCRNEFDKNWYEFDDSIVTRVNALEVMSREAYMLFYQKKTSESLQKSRQHCHALLLNSWNRDLNVLVDGDRFYISREWLHKFINFSEPGHINNCDFLCSHGLLTPEHSAMNSRRRMYMFVSSNVWSYLVQLMGGGPECRELVECEKCRRVQDRLMKRKLFERNTWKQLEAECTYEDVFPMNAISLHWIEKWKAFINQANSEPPPPINNESLVRKCKDGTRLRNGAKFLKIRRGTWLFLQGIYGGGPEVLAMPFNQPSSEEITKHLEKIEARNRAMALLETTYSNSSVTESTSTAEITNSTDFEIADSSATASKVEEPASEVGTEAGLLEEDMKMEVDNEDEDSKLPDEDVKLLNGMTDDGEEKDESTKINYSNVFTRGT